VVKASSAPTPQRQLLGRKGNPLQSCSRHFEGASKNWGAGTIK
jgi:hypothetical protein